MKRKRTEREIQASETAREIRKMLKKPKGWKFIASSCMYGNDCCLRCGSVYLYWAHFGRRLLYLAEVYNRANRSGPWVPIVASRWCNDPNKALKGVYKVVENGIKNAQTMARSLENVGASEDEE